MGFAVGMEKERLQEKAVRGQYVKVAVGYYAGILSHKYVCQAVLGTRIEGFVLLYYPGENTWNMVLAEEYLTDMFPRIWGN